jgi:hypothetical protein
VHSRLLKFALVLGLLILFSCALPRASAAGTDHVIATPPVVFGSPITDKPISVDGDSSIDALAVYVPVQFNASGFYTLKGEFFTPSGKSLGIVSTGIGSLGDTKTYSLIIGAESIAATSEPGPYTVKMTLLDQDSVTIYAEATYLTTAYPVCTWVNTCALKYSIFIPQLLQ